MNEQMMSREELVIWLRDAIAAETDKPESEIDYAFVDECMAMLSELMTDEYNLTPEQINSKVQKITSNHSTVSAKKKPMKLKRLVVIAVAAAVLICGTIAVLATPYLRHMVMRVLGMEVGESIEYNGVTYINSGEGKVYSNIAELVEQEGLDIMYPHKLPEGLEITKVVKFEEEDKIIVIFNDENINFTVKYNITNLDNHTNTDDIVSYNNISFYIYSKPSDNHTRYSTYAIDTANNILYFITGYDKSVINELIQNFY